MQRRRTPPRSTTPSRPRPAVPPSAAGGMRRGVGCCTAPQPNQLSPRTVPTFRQRGLPVPTQSSALRAELAGLRLRALQQRALEVGAEEHKIDEAFDGDDVKGNLVALIVSRVAAGAAESQEVAQRSALRAELSSMKLSALCARAKEMGVSEEVVDRAFDADDVKDSLVSIIVQRTPRERQHAKSSRPHHGGGVNIRGSSADEAAAPTKPAPAAAQHPRKHVMLSYNWDYQRTVKRVYDKLTALGIFCWMDVAGGMLSGDIYESMAAGVSNACVVVCFMCQQYQESTNCMLEVRSNFATQSGA
jgi:hypothetical protein